MAPKRLQYSESSMDAACLAVSNGRSIRAAAKEHGVPHTTLRERLKGRISMRKEGHLVEWVAETSRRGFGKTREQILTTVQSVLKETGAMTPFKDQKPGRRWFSNFRNRHKTELSMRTPQAFGSQRAGTTEKKLVDWFDTAEKDIKAVDPDVLNHPERIYNCDESGFQLGGGICRVLAPKGDKRVYQITNDTHRQVTVLACGNAAGEMQPPLLIFPGQRFNYDPLAGFPEAHLARSSNGWIDSDIFEKWFETGFCPAVATQQKPVVLFVDEHSSHLTLKVHELCKQHSIIFYELPSHASHVVQPLDLTTFKSLKQEWQKQVMSYQEESADTLSKRDFAKVFKKTWDNGLKKETIISGFEAAGIYPWDSTRFDRSKLGPARLFVQEGGDAQDAIGQQRQETEGTQEQGRVVQAGETEEAGPSTEISGMEEQHTLTDVRHRIGQTISNGGEQTDIKMSQQGWDLMKTVDRLLDLSAAGGCAKLVHYRTLVETGTVPTAPEEKYFCDLYKSLVDRSSAITCGTSGQGLQTFQNLPLPSRWKSVEKKRHTLQPPKMLSSEAFKEFKLSQVRQKQQEEEKERKRKERLEKRARVQEEKLKRQKEKEEKAQKKRVEKTLQNKKGKGKGKKNVCLSSESEDNVSLTSSKCVDKDSDSDMDIDMNNRCYGCDGEKDDDCGDWVGCECNRWFHIQCADDDNLLGKSVDELDKITYVCPFCK